MRCNAIKIFLFFLFLCPSLLKGQPEITLKHYTSGSGLSQKMVSKILQTSNGYMWFATGGGLDRYDGYEFRNYRAYPGDNTTFSNRLLMIKENYEGNIWCISYDRRAYLFDVAQERFIDVLAPLEQELKRKLDVVEIFPLKKRVTWISFRGGEAVRIDESTYPSEGAIAYYGQYDNSLYAKKIYYVRDDDDGGEWILTDYGLNIFGEKEFKINSPYFLWRKRGKTIWLASKDGNLAFYNLYEKRLQTVDLGQDVEQINYMIILKSGEIAIGTDKGLLLYNHQTRTTRNVNLTAAGHAPNYVTLLDEDSYGNIWIFTKADGVVRYHYPTSEIQHLATPEAMRVEYERETRTFIYEDRQGHLWVFPRNGILSYYNREKKQLQPILLDDKLYAPLVRSYQADEQGNLWLCTNSGVDKLSFERSNYEFMPVETGMEVRAMLIDARQRLWLATKSDKVRIYSADRQQIGFLSPNGEISSREQAFGAKVYCIMQDKQNNIWLGAKMGGVYKLTPIADNRFSVKHYVHNPNDKYSLSHDDVYSIIQDERGQIWVGTFGGGINLLQQHVQTGKVRFIHSANKLCNYPSSFNRVRQILPIGNGVLMAGTTDGLLVFSDDFSRPEEIVFKEHQRRPDDPTSLANNDVKNILKASDGTVYIATFSGGVNYVKAEDVKSDSISFKGFTRKDGLVSDITQSIIEDSCAHIWIASENALSCYFPRTGSFRNTNLHFVYKEFNISEGMPLLLDDGSILYGTGNGILRINPYDTLQNSFCPSIVFTDIKVQGKEINGINKLSLLTLEPSQRNISFTFAALDYANDANVKYAYRMLGLEDDWHYTENNRMASFLNLPKGKWTFQVKSTNGDGIWVDNMVSLPIHVKPKFRETIWAWLLFALLFLCFLYLVVRVLYYIYRLRHRIDFERQLSNIKLRFFTDVSHELRTPLTLIASPVNEVLETEQLTPAAKENLMLVRKNTERMLRLVNQILDFRKIQNKKMKVLVEETSVIPFVASIMDNFKPMAEQKHLEFSLDAEKQDIHVWVDRDKLEKIIFNLLSNAFKYTPDGRSVKVMIRQNGKTVTIVVADTGIGMKTDKMDSIFNRFETIASGNIMQPSSGIGLSLVRELVDLLHAQISVSSKLGQGTAFTLTLPMGKEHFVHDPLAEFIVEDAESSAPIDSRADSQIEVNENEDLASSSLPTILVVEDNEEMRLFLHNILSTQYHVVEASNGREGLEKALRLLPDFIVSDVMMPEMDGLEMVKKIKEDANACHIPIVLLSAKSSLDDRIEGLEHGVDDYISKPFSATYLKTRIKNLMEQREQLQQRYKAHLMDETTASASKTMEYAPSEPQVMPQDEIFMAKVMDFINSNIANSDMSMDDFAAYMAVSRSILYRKLKAIVGMSPIDFVVEMRIKRAAQLIQTGEYNIAEVAFQSGFSDPKYFSKSFKKQMGMTPSEYKASTQNP